MCASLPPALREGLRLDVRQVCHACPPPSLRKGLRLDVRLVSLCYSMSVRSQNSSAGVTKREIRNVYA
jgi:hypothetical protein